MNTSEEVIVKINKVFSEINRELTLLYGKIKYSQSNKEVLKIDMEYPSMDIKLDIIVRSIDRPEYIIPKQLRDNIKNSLVMYKNFIAPTMKKVDRCNQRELLIILNRMCIYRDEIVNLFNKFEEGLILD